MTVCMLADSVSRCSTATRVACCFIAALALVGASFNYWGSTHHFTRFGSTTIVNEYNQTIGHRTDLIGSSTTAVALDTRKLPKSSKNAVMEAVSTCNVGVDTPCMPPLLPKKTMFITSEKHHLAVCKIEKVMSTFLTGTVCYLNDPAKFLDAGRTIHSEVWSKRFCKKRIEHFVMPTDPAPTNVTPDPKTKTKNKNRFTRKDDWHFLAVVREPISRFLSGFMNKCVVEYNKGNAHRCYSCRKNMTCFVDKLYRNAQMFVETSGEKYLTFEGKHFFPQNWYCGFNDYPYHVVHYGSGANEGKRMSEEIIKVLKKAKVNDSQLKYINSELNFKSPHATKNQSVKEQYELELWKSPYLMRKIVQLYYFDFVLFGFPLPFDVTVK